MSKQNFLAELREGLSGLPKTEIEERLTFYSEMIDDRMEEGLTEDSAVEEIGTVQDVVSQIMSEIPLSRFVKERVKPRRALRVWEIVLLALGSPIWISLLLAAFAIVISIFAVFWSLIVFLWAFDFSMAVCSIDGFISSVIFAVQGNVCPGFAMFGFGFACAGASVLLFFGCIKVTKSTLALTKKIIMSIKYCFIGKGGNK